MANKTTNNTSWAIAYNPKFVSYIGIEVEMREFSDTTNRTGLRVIAERRTTTDVWVIKLIKGDGRRPSTFELLDRVTQHGEAAMLWAVDNMHNA